VRDQLEERLGAALTVGPVTVNGFRGLRIADLRLTTQSEDGPRIEFSAPAALVNINLGDLLHSKITLDRVVIDNCHIRVVRPEGTRWFEAEDFGTADLLPFDRSDSFRITGDNSIIEIQNVVGDTELVLEDVRFDVSRLADSPDLIARLESTLGGDAEKPVRVRLALASLEDFNLKIDAATINADDVNIFLPSEHHFVSQGLSFLALTVHGRPGKAALMLEADFTDLVIRGQPEFLPPATGTLTANASYSTETNRVEITHARATSQELSGDVEGSVSFDGVYPEFDLRLVADRLPARQLLDYAFAGQFDFSGDTVLELNEPHEVVLAFQGTIEDPLISGFARAGSGHLEYSPQDKNQPHFSLDLGQVEAEWNPNLGALSVRLAVQDGEATHEGTGLKASDLKGAIALENGVLHAESITGTLTENSFVASMTYNVEEAFGELTLSGVLSRIEDLPFATKIPLTEIAGSVNLMGLRLTKSGDTYSAEGNIDATQLRIDHSWWLTKPEGIGATAHLSADFKAHSHLRMKATEANIASSKFAADLSLTYARDESGAGWTMDEANAESETFNVTALGRCVRIPYRITGGTGHNGKVAWRADPDSKGAWSQVISCSIDDLQLLPMEEGAQTPLNLRGAELRATMTRGDQSTGSLSLHVEESTMPSFHEPWFLPYDRRNAHGVEMPFVERTWAFTLESRVLDLPPWKGRNFHATAYTNPESVGVDAYSAEIEDGRISGSYHANRAEHSFGSSVEWASIPSHYFIEHLGFPEILSGTMTGNVSYTLDRDDPGTLKGGGSFAVADGHFSADFLHSLLEEQIEDEALALPNSLKYSLLDIRGLKFDGDRVDTPSFSLAADGFHVAGSGYYIRDGDMDYTLQLGITPAVAKEIPVLRDSFNIQGMKLAQKNIDLTIEFEGPTFNPQGRVSDLPAAGTMLISATLGVTGRILDTPRRLLFDIIKSAGGIMGAVAN
jgi:hypothetical protein